MSGSWFSYPIGSGSVLEQKRIRINSDLDRPKFFKFPYNQSFNFCKNYSVGTEVLFSTNFKVSIYVLTVFTKFSFYSRKNLVSLHKIFVFGSFRLWIRIIYLDPDPANGFRSFRIRIHHNDVNFLGALFARKLLLSRYQKYRIYGFKKVREERFLGEEEVWNIGACPGHEELAGCQHQVVLEDAAALLVALLSD